jgi:LysM repeat protein
MTMRKLLGTTIIVAALAAVPTIGRADAVYTVKAGDSLYAISRVFGTSVDQIKALNGLAGEKLQPGDRLRIPDGAIDSSFSRSAKDESQAKNAPARTPAPQVAALPAAAAAATAVTIAEPRILPRCTDETVIHIIEKGDTLGALSRRYDVPVEDLLVLNNLTRKSVLSVGAQLAVKRAGPMRYTIMKGDSLSAIAHRFDIDIPDLRDINSLEGDVLRPGQTLVVQQCRLGADLAAVPDYGAPGELYGPFLAESESVDDVIIEDMRAQEMTDEIIALAKELLNIPYRFGGTTLRGIDCSAYVQRVFGLNDIKLPRTAREQFKVAKATVPFNQLSVGDLVFFRTYARFPSHVGIYLGDNRFIHASSKGRKVTIDSLDAPYYKKRFLGGKRLL